jgi:TonB-dependent starch-binding outer membrane protein SusC
LWTCPRIRLVERVSVHPPLSTMRHFLLRRVVGQATLAIMMAVLADPVLAQVGTISGRVLDAASGETLIGVNVIVESLNIGAATDLDGNYSIDNVPVGEHLLTARFISFTPVTQTVVVSEGAVSTVDFELAPIVHGMDELIVTATGVKRRAEIGNAIGRIDAAEQVTLRPISDVAGLLQGQASGVQILGSGGSTGMGSRIRIRGSNSASLSNEPVIYVDGVLINNTAKSISFETGGQAPSRLNDINPEDIESIEIIRGPSAATLYGSVAANGVIRITTKRGRRGPPRWTAFLESGAVNDVGGYPANFQALDGGGNPCFTFEAAEGDCSQASVNSLQPLNESATSPFRTGQSYGMGLNVSGGTDALTYYLSGSFSDAEGVLPVNSARRASFRGNFGSQVTDDLRINLTTGYVKNDLTLPLNDNYALGLMGQGLNGSATPTSNGGWGEFTPEELFTIDTRQNIDRFTTGLQGVWTPHESLSVTASGGIDFTSRWDNQFFPTGEAPAFLGFDEGARFSNRFNEYVYTLDAVGSYTRSLSENFNSRTSVGLQYLRNLSQGTLSTGLQLVAGTSSIAGAATTTSVEQTAEQRTMGVFVEEQIGFRDRLFITGAVRSDRGSAFGTSLSSVVYPKLSVSWLISEEDFFGLDAGLVSSLRLRGAWGASGVQPGTNDALRFFLPIAATVDGGLNVTGVTFGGVGNSDLKPERSSEIEIGADATILSDKVGVELTYFNKETSDALVFRQLPLSLGVGAGRFENLGSVRNSGIELGLSVQFYQSSAVSVSMDFASAFLDNELLALGEGIEPVIFGVQRHVEGSPLGGYWDEEYTFNDANGDGLIGRDEVQVGELAYLGAPFATTDISFTPRVTLFDGRVLLFALFNYRGGQSLYNNTGAWRNGNSNTRELNDPTASLENQARAIASKFYGTNAGYIEDSSFWRFRELSVTLSAPDSWVKRAKVSRMAFTVSGQNLGIWTDYSGLDPEINSIGASNFSTQEFLSQPPVRSWKARLNITF